MPPKSWRTRRRQKLLWFLAVESIVLLVMVLSVLAGVSARFASESLTPIFRVLPVAAAVGATIFPILFFGHKRSSR